MIEPKRVLKTVHILGVENQATNDVIFNQANICEETRYCIMIVIFQFSTIKLILEVKRLTRTI